MTHTRRGSGFFARLASYIPLVNKLVNEEEEDKEEVAQLQPAAEEASDIQTTQEDMDDDEEEVEANAEAEKQQQDAPQEEAEAEEEGETPTPAQEQTVEEPQAPAATPRRSRRPRTRTCWTNRRPRHARCAVLRRAQQGAAGDAAQTPQQERVPQVPLALTRERHGEWRAQPRHDAFAAEARRQARVPARPLPAVQDAAHL